MPSQAYVGRVGGVAVALGVGAAIVTGWGGGLAWADESGGTPGSNTASSSSDTQPATANADAAQETAKSVDTGATTTTRAATTGTKGSVTKDGAVRSAPAGVVVGTGGLKRDDSASSTEPPPSKTAAPPGTSAHDARTSKPATSKRSDPSAGKPTKKTPAPLSAVADAKKDATPPATETRTETTEGGRANLITDRPEATAASASPPNAPTQTLSSATQGKELTTESTAKQMSPVMTAVTRLASGFVNAILSPLAASNTPGVPTDTPATWALLAFA
jgi:beta-galactosidase